MIQKLIILLIIQITFLKKFEKTIYSYKKENLYSYPNEIYFINKNNNIIPFFNNFKLSIFSYNNNNEDEIFYKLFNYSYIISFRFNIIQVEYSILFFSQNQSLITPSDLGLLYDLHIICRINRIGTYMNIDSLASIYLNKYFHCIEFININEKANFGILIYKSQNQTILINSTHYFFNNSIINYNNQIFQNNKFFYPLFIEKQFYSKDKNKESSSLKQLYNSFPVLNTKSNVRIEKNDWKFFNIYNHYFCFCKGDNCLYHNLLNPQNSTQICKYKFYLNLIEQNKHLYNKTDYLLADFPGDFQSLDDAFPLFQKLINLKQNAYYMTINKQIFDNQNIDDNLYRHIIKGNFINGDFIEKNFELFLRLKAVISGAEYMSFKNLFYFIDYITFISLTHGLNFFKVDLFKTYYGRNRYHKLVISTSKKIISLATQNGWEEKDLIKICLPKWDKFSELKKKKFHKKDRSIFFFFTWRNWNKNISDEVKLKSDYFKNIVELMNNDVLIDTFENYNITLKFCLHHMLEIYKDKLYFSNRNIQFIKQNEIFDSITHSNLLVTDFSSIIFEFMYLNKPFVMYIPDNKEINIKKFYSENYINLINGLKDGSISFINKYFDINQVVDKIIYYINNNFIIEEEVSDFYKSFNLTCENNTMKFINYLENLENKS